MILFHFSTVVILGKDDSTHESFCRLKSEKLVFFIGHPINQVVPVAEFLTVLKRPAGDRIGQEKCHHTVFGVVAATVQSPCALLKPS